MRPDTRRRNLARSAVFHLVLAGIGLQAWPHAARADVDQALFSRLKSEGPKSWGELARALEGIEIAGTRRVETRYLDAGKPARKEQKSIWMVDWDPIRNRRLIEYHNEGTKATTRRVLNDDYLFYVSFLSDQGRYQLVSCRRLASAESFRTFDMADRDFEGLLESGFRVVGVSLADMLQEADSFRPKAIVAVRGAADVPLVHVEFDYLGPDQPPRRSRATYWADLNPRDRWRIEKAGYHLPAKGQDQEILVSYREVGGVPVPRAISNTFDDKCQQYNHTIIYELDAPREIARPDREYFLPCSRSRGWPVRASRRLDLS